MAALLIIFAKEPLAGQVKTRLSPPLSPKAAARLYQYFLEDILEEMGSLPEIRLAVAYSPDKAKDFFRKMAPSGALLFSQEGDDLSTRLVRAFDRGFAAGFKTVLVRNSDSPDLPEEIVLAAEQALTADGADLVLSPSPDGGYNLVGLKQPQPRLFQGISWSSPRVLADTLGLARQLFLAVHLLPSWPDIDTMDDLRAFAARPLAPGTPGRRSHLFTHELLEKISQ
ncbi:MAG: TIGR04282 family arsenosugar biosynthesis glycosyltransferase [Syntrophales bacterium]|nr:TIGR04282 family arsenosugar biosynthesis glycosyltransferase [Syntrophales bacterium]MDD5641534.1 TIGR04282 family arsenosugar biosynthesis glycosyltransferase [Syntrophales bacterium]